MNPENLVVKLCVEGMKAESAGYLPMARLLFMQAWDARRDVFEACIAAHYLARHQPDAAATLHWNQVALAYADRVGDERVAGFYPSLYLNLGWSHEQLGDEAEARRYYDLAAQGAGDLPQGRYRGIVAGGAARGVARVPDAPASEDREVADE